MADKTVTVKPSGGDYASLNAALAGEDDINPDLTAMAGILYIDCYSMQDDTLAATGTGYTVNASYYVCIRGAASDKTSINTGKWSVDRYRLVYTAAAAENIAILWVQLDYTRVLDLQIHLLSTSASVSKSGYYIGSATGCEVHRCIARATLVTPTGTNRIQGFVSYRSGSSGTNYFYNCLAYDFAAGTYNYAYGFYSDSASTYNHVHCYNCTAQNCRLGFFRNAATMYAYNCGAAGSNTAFGSLTGETTCSSSTPTFVNEAGDDFHLATSDSIWRNQGTDYTGTFSDDIDGQGRPVGAGTWDIGCDEAGPIGAPGSVYIEIKL